MSNTRPIIYGLWIGGELGAMEKLSLQSFLAQGHEYHLYAYEDVGAVPRGVQVKDAATIIPADKVFKIAGSYAGFSNSFRYKLLAENAGFWADTDVICTRPFEFDAELVFASERILNTTQTKIANCVMGAREPGSEVMTRCYERALNTDTSDYRWGMLGPDLVNQVVAELGLQNFILPPEVFCPVDYWNWTWFALPFCPLDINQGDTRAVHLWHQFWKVNGLDKNALFPPHSLYEILKRHSGYPGAAQPRSANFSAAEVQQQAVAALRDQAVDKARHLLEHGLAFYPNELGLLRLAAMVYVMRKQLPQAEAAAHAVLKQQASPEAHYDLGMVMQHQTRWREAEAAYRQALQLKPDYAEAENNLAFCLHEQGRYMDAVRLYRQAIQHKPDYARAYTNLGITLNELEQWTEAEAMHRQALALQPNLAEAHSNLANALKKQARYAEALEAAQQAVALQPKLAEAYLSMGHIFEEKQQFNEAIAAYRQALQLKPRLLGAAEALLHILKPLCAWDAASKLEQRLSKEIRQGQAGLIRPFLALHLFDDPALLQRCAQQRARRSFQHTEPRPEPARGKREKLRLGYLSADFGPHPLSYLMVEVFELHDRQRFEVFAYSCNKENDSDIRRRIEAGFDHFRSFPDASNAEIARQIQADGIDILIDLGGYTKDGRTRVLALHPAPLQAQYLGFPGTLGSSHIDYIIADKTVIPETSRRFFDENVVWLPDTYFPTDRQMPVAALPSREEAGLPARGFVFCCFNRAMKITAPMFALWMRLLHAVPDSVLWLLDAHSITRDNLRQAAQQQGIAAERIIFAPKRPLDEHLARYALADLVLDTLPYNAHTTLVDALWVGVPALTCMGESFAARVGGSLLQAAGLPELITDNPSAYEERALQLAQEPETLAALKHQLQAQRSTCALFDTPRFTRHLENAYEQMWRRAVQGLPPAHLQVEAAKN